jgi:hypothetical protein
MEGSLTAAVLEASTSFIVEIKRGDSADAVHRRNRAYMAWSLVVIRAHSQNIPNRRIPASSQDIVIRPKDLQMGA